MTNRLKKIWRQLGIPADYPARRHLPLQREARTLASVGPAADDGRPVRLVPAARDAWACLQSAARADGIQLLPLSGYRSIARQTKNIRRRLAGGEKIADILKFVAAPGCSEHHTGRALDLGSPGKLALDGSFAKTAGFRWLKRHATRFGFQLSYPRRNPHGIAYEPWHWCWHRVSPAEP